MAISKKTTEEVWKRCGWCCEECKIPFIKWVIAPHPQAMERHHIYSLWQYKKDDRDEARNIAMLCPKHHKYNKTWVHWWNRKLHYRLRQEADLRKPRHERSTVSVQQQEKKVLPKPAFVKKRTQPKVVVNWKLTPAQKQFKKEINQSYIDKFKLEHNWYTPTQRSYRQNKKYLAEKKKHDL